MANDHSFSKINPEIASFRYPTVFLVNKKKQFAMQLTEEVSKLYA